MWRVDECFELVLFRLCIGRGDGIRYGFLSGGIDAVVGGPDNGDGLGYRVRESVLKMGSLRLIRGTDEGLANAEEAFSLERVRDIIGGGADLDGDATGIVLTAGVCPSFALVLVCDCWLEVDVRGAA